MFGVSVCSEKVYILFVDIPILDRIRLQKFEKRRIRLISHLNDGKRQRKPVEKPVETVHNYMNICDVHTLWKPFMVNLLAKRRKVPVCENMRICW